MHSTTTVAQIVSARRPALFHIYPDNIRSSYPSLVNLPTTTYTSSTEVHVTPSTAHHRRGSITSSSSSLTPSEHRLLNQNFLSFTWEYLCKIADSLFGLPFLRFVREKMMNIADGGATEERKTYLREVVERVGLAKVGVFGGGGKVS